MTWRRAHSWQLALIASAAVPPALAKDTSILAPQGLQAAQILDLFRIFFWVCLGVFAAVVSVLVLALLGRPVKTSAEDDIPAVREGEQPAPDTRVHALETLDERGERRRGIAVGVATGVTALILVGLLWASIATGKVLHGLGPPAVTIEVVGQQWWWQVRYLDADPSKTFVTANEIHIPVGVPVELKLNSRDVIHSFWVPNLHGKRDLIPGMENTLRLQASAPGVFRGQCAEFCGLAHAKMAIRIIAERPETFNAWREAQRSPAFIPETALQQRGQELFLTGPCAMCHGISGTPARGNTAPDLSHLASRQGLAADAIPNVRGHLAGWVVNAQGIKPGNKMPSISLPPDDLQALLAYLEALR